MKSQLSLKKVIDMVREFMDTYQLKYFKKPKADIGLKTHQLRFELMKEENQEYLEATKNGDVVEVADALGDMLYILCGTILAHGMQDKIEEVFTEIQRSNMSKLGKNGKPIYREDGKVLKGPHYSEPDLKEILTR